MLNPSIIIAVIDPEHASWVEQVVGPFGALVLAISAVYFLVKENQKASANANTLMERFIALVEKQIAAQELVNKRLESIEEAVDALKAQTGRCAYAVEYCKMRNSLKEEGQ